MTWNPIQVEATPDIAPPAYYSSPNEGSTQPSTYHASDLETQDTKKPEPEPIQSTISSAQAATAATVASVKSATAETYEELKAKLATAEETIARLTNEAASGLRQRKAAVATTLDEKNVAGQAQELAQAVRQGTEGVPVQVAAVLCLVSFLLAYFFF